MAFYDHQPLIQPLYRVATDVMAGEIAVPRFQRPGTEQTWEPEQRRELLDSLLRGFPIGTILLWPSKVPMATFRSVGGFPVGGTEGEGLRRYLLDGHQRLSSVVQILGEGLFPDLQARGVTTVQKENIEVWYFDLSVGAESGTSLSRFLWFNSEQAAQEQAQAENLLLLPLKLVLNRAALNRWLREQSVLTDEQVRQAENLRDSLREYSVPIMQLQAGSLEDAAESFKRINASGTPVSPFFMVTALAYRHDFDPQQVFEDMRARYLEPLAWGDVDDSDLLRICIGLHGEDPTTLEVEKLAKVLVVQPVLVERAFVAASNVAKIFHTLGVHGPQMLPYRWQWITAAIALGRPAAGLNEEPTAHDSQAIRQWFWLSGYGEFFSSGNRRSTFAYALDVLLAMLGGEDPQIQPKLRVEKKIKPITRFDFRAARAKLCLLAMAKVQDGGQTDGPAHRTLLQGPGALAALRGTKRSEWWNLLIMTPDLDIDQIRADLQQCAQANLPPTPVLHKLGFGVDARRSVELLLRVRKQLIETTEKGFIDQFGLVWDSTQEYEIV